MSEATILLLPGNMCDGRLWAPLAQRLAHVPFHLHTGDLSSQDTIRAMAEDMLHLHSGDLIPIGFSMGAIVGLEMARRQPERLRGLGLLAVNAGADLPERTSARPRQQKEVRAGALARIVADELKPNYLARENRGDRRLLELTMAMAIALGPETFCRQSEALRTRQDFRAALSGLRMPVLLSCGEEDALCPPEWHRRWLSSLEGDRELHVIAGAGHLLPLERPEALAGVLVPWLGRI